MNSVRTKFPGIIRIGIRLTAESIATLNFMSPIVCILGCRSTASCKPRVHIVYTTDILDAQAHLTAEIPVQNDRTSDESVEVSVQVFDPAGKSVLHSPKQARSEVAFRF